MKIKSKLFVVRDNADTKRTVCWLGNDNFAEQIKDLDHADANTVNLDNQISFYFERDELTEDIDLIGKNWDGEDSKETVIQEIIQKLGVVSNSVTVVEYNAYTEPNKTEDFLDKFEQFLQREVGGKWSYAWEADGCGEEDGLCFTTFNVWGKQFSDSKGEMDHGRGDEQNETTR
jgi:hypothetical protein